MLLDELAGDLIAQNIASSSGSGTGWLLYRGRMADGEGDRAVALIETGGAPPLLNVDVGQPSVQALVRGASVLDASSAYEEARLKANEILGRWHGLPDVTFSGVRYPIILAQGDVIPVGDDGNQRPLFSVNFIAWREST